MGAPGRAGRHLRALRHGRASHPPPRLKPTAAPASDSRAAF
jgi:hypothetical protein